MEEPLPTRLAAGQYLLMEYQVTVKSVPPTIAELSQFISVYSDWTLYEIIVVTELGIRRRRSTFAMTTSSRSPYPHTDGDT